MKQEYKKPCFQVISSVKGYAQLWCGKGHSGVFCNQGGK